MDKRELIQMLKTILGKKLNFTTSPIIFQVVPQVVMWAKMRSGALHPGENQP